jgi:phage N-6-adenine-methyltransferase
VSAAPQLALAAPLGTLEARRLTNEVKADAAALWAKLLRLYEGGAHTALGYPSWADYCRDEFDMGKSHAYRLLDAGRVAELLEPHSPIGEWRLRRTTASRPHGGTSAVGPLNESVARELVPVLREDPEEVEGVWAEVVELHGDDPTASETRAVVEEKLSPAQLIASSNSNEWYTPARYVEAARRVLGNIDLDPASCAAANATVGAARYLTEEEDGLAHPWAGRVWMNPPYGRLVGEFVAKLVDEYTAGNVTAAVALLNANSVGTSWFERLWDGVLCFTRGRINFENGEGHAANSPTHGTAFVYFGPHPERFAGGFSRFGVIARRWPS